MAETLAAVGGAAALLELSKAACSLASTLYAFHRNTKNVNETVNDLASEVNALGNACAMVYGLLATLEKEHGSETWDQDGQYHIIRESVGDQVQECQRTVNSLAKSIEGVQKEGSNFVAQASRQIRLNLKKEGIADIRNRMRLHMSCLQITLQSLNMGAPLSLVGSICTITNVYEAWYPILPRAVPIANC